MVVLRRRFWRYLSLLLLPNLLVALAIGVFAGSGTLIAPPGWMSGTQQASEPLEQVGRGGIGGGGIGAPSVGYIRALDGYAYVGSYIGAHTCTTAVQVVDVRNPAAPKPITRLASYPLASSPIAVPARVATPFFQGDLLTVAVNESSNSVSNAYSGDCRGAVRPSGLALFDVTQPSAPVELAYLPVPPLFGLSVEGLDIAVQGERVLAVLAVATSEDVDAPMVAIFDISNPAAPAPVATWGSRTQFAVPDDIGCSYGAPYAKSVRVSPDQQRVYLGTYGAGVVVLDIADPEQPRQLARLYDRALNTATYEAVEIHPGLVAVAEYDVDRRVEVEARWLLEYAHLPGCFGIRSPWAMRNWESRTEIVDIGTGCRSVAPAPGKVALATASGCPVGQVAATARDAGFKAVLLVWVPGSDERPLTTFPWLSLPMVHLHPEDGEWLRSRMRFAPVAVTLPSRRLSGGVQIWDWSNPSAPVLRSTYRTGHADGLQLPEEFAFFTARSVAVRGRLVYVNWMNDGVRVLDVSDPDHPREVASWVPDGFTIFTDITLAGDYVLVADLSKGLWVVKAGDAFQ